MARTRTRIPRGTLGFVIALVFTAPAVAQTPRPGFEAIRSIGVISALGERAEIKYVGAMVFGNQLTYLPISDWRLDALAGEQAAKALADHYVVKQLTVDPALFANVHSSPFRSEVKSLAVAVQALPLSDVDAYLFILPATESLPYPSNQSVSGLGVYRTWPGVQGPDFQLHAGEAIVHLTYAVYLVDAKTGRMIAGHLGASSAKETRSFAARLLMVGALTSPHAYTHDGSWPTTAATLTAPQIATLRKSLTNLIEISLGYTVGRMGLAARTTPSPGN